MASDHKIIPANFEHVKGNLYIRQITFIPNTEYFNSHTHNLTNFTFKHQRQEQIRR